MPTERRCVPFSLWHGFDPMTLRMHDMVIRRRCLHLAAKTWLRFAREYVYVRLLSTGLQLSIQRRNVDDWMVNLPNSV